MSEFKTCQLCVLLTTESKNIKCDDLKAFVVDVPYNLFMLPHFKCIIINRTKIQQFSHQIWSRRKSLTTNTNNVLKFVPSKKIALYHISFLKLYFDPLICCIN